MEILLFLVTRKISVRHFIRGMISCGLKLSVPCEEVKGGSQDKLSIDL